MRNEKWEMGKTIKLEMRNGKWEMGNEKLKKESHPSFER